MKLNAIRAWKDEAYRASLSEEERSMLPASPVGELELSDAELESVLGAQGGLLSVGITSVICASANVIPLALLGPVSCSYSQGQGSSSAPASSTSTSCTGA
ncbi:MAG: mersacidin/lichenicidin family type 2 lantibiotic [Chloroflexi bacterium]|nr:mersacidin/lichenicidin family type 2 lantibiotic [Chloroflexota bacterium]